MNDTHAMRPTLGVAIIAAIAAACFSSEGEENRLAAHRVREARAAQAVGTRPAPAIPPRAAGAATAT
jgi:hypothetical protein